MVSITTITCEACGTIVAGNVLERHRHMKCPRLGCEHILRFSDLPEEGQGMLVEQAERYVIES